MTSQTKLNLCLRLPFDGAGVEFNIEVNETGSDDGRGPGFSLTVLDLESGDRVPFASHASIVLADWVRGYSRWLYRAGVAAQYTYDSITGTFAADLTAEQVLEGLRLACDMIRQRFELYEDSVLVL